ncbi:hypothetical protein BJF83_14700 [Nocardiopsis sp. CNR-923]|uniref:hypothetical protein n=1 Tax=Nocardiopsis sp. CNR-923 TaxID=1904965 RepID=UPI0009596F4A|nr:hypothetical protein [Nocardiopsis sp. CNR-923]OLT28630.1 hypothetical protein BJF83_14700 [Nocardiopsis sp. CNR-923]
MMEFLRSRRFKIALASVVVVGLVVSGALGLFQALRAPTPPAPVQTPDPGAAQNQERSEAPDVDALGDPPEGLSYVSGDADVRCSIAECVRLVRVVAAEGEQAPGSEEAIASVYDHLLGADWGQLLPEGAQSPGDVPLGDTILTDGDVMVTDSSEHDARDATALLMLGNANPPAS